MENNSLIWKQKNETLLAKCISWDYTLFFFFFFLQKEEIEPSYQIHFWVFLRKKLSFTSLLSLHYIQEVFFPSGKPHSSCNAWYLSLLYNRFVHLSNGKDLLHNGIHFKWMVCSHVLYPAHIEAPLTLFQEAFPQPNWSKFQDICAQPRCV